MRVDMTEAGTKGTRQGFGELREKRRSRRSKLPWGKTYLGQHGQSRQTQGTEMPQIKSTPLRGSFKASLHYTSLSLRGRVSFLTITEDNQGSPDPAEASAMVLQLDGSDYCSGRTVDATRQASWQRGVRCIARRDNSKLST